MAMQLAAGNYASIRLGRGSRRSLGIAASLDAIHGFPALPYQASDFAAPLNALICEHAVLISAVGLSFRGATASTVETAHGFASLGRCTATLLCPLRSGRASRGFFKRILLFHGIARTFSRDTPPPPGSCRGVSLGAVITASGTDGGCPGSFAGVPCETLPTIACPPAFTVTCSTVTFCCPVLR